MSRRRSGVTAPARQEPGPDPTADEAESDALESLRLYKTIFERGSLGELIVDYTSLSISVANAAFCAMTGFSPDELIGQAVGVIFPVDQDPSANTIERLAESTTDGYFVERTLQRRDGSTFPVMSTVSAVRDASYVPITLFVLFRDLTISAQPRALNVEAKRSSTPRSPPCPWRSPPSTATCG
jgi:PAS domain S-box-containing protein